MKWYRKAAEQGYAAAQNNLGVAYEYGWGVPKNYAEAVKWYRKAAEQGYAYAQYNLGLMYDNGRGVPQDYAAAVKWYRKAAKWYRKAAEQGDAVAQYNLGVMYRDGRGVPQDYAEALRWFRKAAVQGNDYGKRMLRILEKAMEMRRAHPHAPKLFGVPLVGAMRAGMREAARRAGVRPSQEDDDRRCDEYDSASVLKGTGWLLLCYSSDSDPNGWRSTDFLAYAQYAFLTVLGAEQVARVRDMVASKYGPPDEAYGSVRVGRVRYVWHRDGVDIVVYRGWPDTTTYLTFEVTVHDMER